MMRSGKPVIRPAGKEYYIVKEILKKYNLNTVCSSAHCPNCSECWGDKTATFLILGNVCTRACRFCSINHGLKGKKLNKEEALNLAEAVRQLKLDYVVLTSVDRDDLKDKGAKHYAECINEIKKTGAKVEILIPDYSEKELRLLNQAEVIGHNIETVRRLIPLIRDKRASYEKSINTLKKAKNLFPNKLTKTSLLLGLGETEKEVYETVDDVKNTGTDIIIFGQYLQPTEKQVKVSTWIDEETFRKYSKYAEKKGLFSFAGNKIRSSYKAKEIYYKLRKNERLC
ncbi:MAG: lipoyl synthase [Candidatus Nanoarchaeia archaeon]|nr:lipoyl synthase [Candidatus Nanoarchaeia archaeon]